MDTQIVAALITVGFTVVAGVVGYFFREYQNRAKPFIAITKINGGITLGHETIDIPDDIRERTSATFYIRRLDIKDSFSELNLAYKNVLEVKKFAPELISLYDRIIAASAVNDRALLLDLLSKALTRNYWEIWMMDLIERTTVEISEPVPGLEVQISTSPSDEFGGCIWIGFPGSPFAFGRGFSKRTLLRNRCAKFVELIARLDTNGLKAFFEWARMQMQTLYDTAERLEPQLKTLLWSNAHWKIGAYVANLGRNPLLIEPVATLDVFDKSGAHYPDVQCHIAITQNLPDGQVREEKASGPLIVGTETGIQLSFVTNKPQREMDRGDDIRNSFNLQAGTCVVSFQVQKPGMRRTKILRTPKVPFVESAMQA